VKNKKTTEQFIREARSKHGHTYDYSKTVYGGSHIKLTITCPRHGEFEQRAHDHLLGKGCPACGLSKSRRKPLTQDEFIRRSQEVHKGAYDYTETVFQSTKKSVRIKCPVHGFFWQNAGQHLFKGHGCPGCGHRGDTGKPSSFQTLEDRRRDWIAKCREVHGDKYDYRKVDYKNAKSKVTILCPEHGHFTQLASNHKSGNGCPECGRLKRLSSHTASSDYYLPVFKEVHGDSYNYESLFPIESSHTPITVTCPKHGPWETKPYIHAQGHGCPKCVGRVSRPEVKLAGIIKDMGFRVRCSDRSVIAPYELDIYVPDAKLAVEYNGNYYHRYPAKEKGYHRNKSLMCLERGIRLIHVYEYDWKRHPERVQRLLRNKLGTGKKIGARECRLVENDSEIVGAFVEEFHDQGRVPDTFNIALEHRGEIVSVMTFGPVRFDSGGGMELLRYCSRDGCRVSGGASRMLRAFRKRFPNERLVTYASLDRGYSGFYTKLGFEVMDVTEPGYVWVRNSPSVEVVSRYKLQGGGIKRITGDRYDASLPQAANMKRAGYFQIYNAGNIKLEYPK
jgi:ferredoxin-like protein FixX